MRNKTKAMIVLAILIAGVAGAANYRIYLIREGSGGTVLWDASEADLFVGLYREGTRVSYLRYPWFLVKEYLGAVESPEDSARSTTVIRVTSSGVERHSVE